MFQQSGHTKNVSLRLSEVLTDMGVDERIVLKRRRLWLVKESVNIKALQVLDSKTSSYFFGSKSEGTTTLGLDSDTDQLISYNFINVIQDWADWEPGACNYFMVQDETVSPGYCLLQLLRGDAPLPYNDVRNKNYIKDRAGRVLLKNTAMSIAIASVVGGVRHGPAQARKGQPGVMDIDTVGAFPCKSWPLHARYWLDQQGVGQWPSDDIRRYCSSTGCFVVAVGSKGSENEDLEWRISTSLAERCLMFNLNITQIRCYVLMKMILKTFIEPHFENTITSYMCKTVLFHCIACIQSNVWRENNLLVCLSLFLFVLYNCILNENCPHFMIPGNNLMRGHISQADKPYILEILLDIINSEGRVLLGIECDQLGGRLQQKLNNLPSLKVSDIISGQLLASIAGSINDSIEVFLIDIANGRYDMIIKTLLKCTIKLVNIHNKSQGVDKLASKILAPWFCTTLGSVLASLNIQQYHTISAEALTWISMGLSTDVASSKLKLASMLYCIGDTQRTETVLRDIERSFDLNIVEPICQCHNFIHQPLRREFNAISDNHNEEAIQYATAFCVRFLPCQMNCVPHELKHEMFRSTEADFAFRRRGDEWMDWAVVDSIPYLYFLQYKTYSNNGRQEDKRRTLYNLVRTIDQEPNLGHRETALNLLGQCMEQEDRATDALHCYVLSFNLKERNNAATYLICRLLSSMINDS